MQTAPYRVIFYRATRRRDGLPQRLPVATINVDGAMPREAAVELAITQFQNRLSRRDGLDAVGDGADRLMDA